MMRWITLAILICSAVAAAAQVYRRVAPDGTVHFSNVPGADAERVDVVPAQTVRMPTAARAGASATPVTPDEQVFRYTRAAILSPGEGEDVRANGGKVTLRLSLEPQLQLQHIIVVHLNDERLAFDHGDTIVLSDLYRGRHSVEVAVMDDDQRELIRTQPVSFFILRVAGGG
jgi:hypothetical protein